MKIQEPEKGVSGCHWHVDEEFDRFEFNVVGGLQLEKV